MAITPFSVFSFRVRELLGNHELQDLRSNERMWEPRSGQDIFGYWSLQCMNSHA